MAIFGLDIFCRDTIDRELVGNCLKSAAGDTTYLHALLLGWGTAVSLALLALVVAMAFGMVMGILRTTPKRGLVLVGDAWTEAFRNIPLMVMDSGLESVDMILGMDYLGSRRFWLSYARRQVFIMAQPRR